MATILLPACSTCRRILEDSGDCPQCSSKAISIDELHRIGADDNVLAYLLYGAHSHVQRFDEASLQSREWFNSPEVLRVVMKWAPLWGTLLFIVFAMFLKMIMVAG